MLLYPDSFICPGKSEFCLLTTRRKIHSAPSRVLATAVDFGVTGNLKIYSLNSDWRGQRGNLQLWSTKNSTYSLEWQSFFYVENLKLLMKTSLDAYGAAQSSSE